MGLSYQNVNLSDLKTHRDMRFGLSITSFKDVIGTFKLNEKYSLVRLSKVLNLEYGDALVEQDRNENGEYPVMGSNGIVGYHDEYLIEGPSIIVGRKGSAGVVTYVEDNNFPIDTTFYVKVKDDTYRLKFLYYLLRVVKLSRLALHKGVPGLNRYDAYEVLIPLVPKDVQDKLLSNVAPLEKELIKLQNKLKQPLDVINSVFAKEFKYSAALWKEFGKGMTAGTQKSNVKTLSTYNIALNEIQRSKLFRFSSRYHNPLTQQVSDILKNLPHRKVSSVIKCIKKGVQPKYDPDGGVRVIKIANMKNGYLDFSESEYTTVEFYEKNKEQAGVELNDILICCTGKVSLGKIDIYEDEEPSILSVDSYIIRVDEQKVDRLFFTYFFRSILGAFQIERDFTGTTNQIHLYDNQILEFDIPDIKISEQRRIVDKIKEELDAQKEIEKQIDKKQLEISAMIEAAIKAK